MCAIAGSINCSDLDLSPLQNEQIHRGPDEQSTYSHNNLNFFHNRLSIVDIKNSHQPFIYEDFVLIFNGEIYNHLELREELKEFQFKTAGDTETLLYLLIKYPLQVALQKIDGMFAIALLNKKSNTLYLIRDRVGKKPLYYYFDNKRFLFASEIRAIYHTIKPKINENEIYNYLRVGYFFKSTIYQNVKPLTSGTILKINLKTLKIKEEKYFNLFNLYKQTQNISLKDAIKKVDTLLHKSIKQRLLSSDLEVGAFLSSGIDSSLICAIASNYTKKLKTFTVSFEGAYDEAPLAKLTALKYQTDHKKITIKTNLKNDIFKILSNYSQPFFDSSAIPSFYVSQEAKKHISVVLNGDGADEFFGGYRRYVASSGFFLQIAKKLSFLKPLLPKPHNKKTLYSHLYRLLEIASKKDYFSFYLSSTIDIFEGYENNILKDFNDELKKHLHQIDALSVSALKKLMLCDDTSLLVYSLLVKMDIASMANSLEARSPFLSKYLLEFAPTLPDGFKINQRTTKYLLRELSKKYLPSKIINQPKRGFEIPLKNWIENDLKEVINDILQPNSYAFNFINKEFGAKLLSNKINISAEKRAKMIWALFTIEVWKNNIRKLQ